jgi:uncharacterized membrane protein
MTRVLWSEIRNIMELQTFFTLIFLAIGFYILPRLGLIPLSMDIYNIITLGAFFNILLLIIVLILLYFEDRKGALFVTLTFFLTNSILSYFTLQFSEDIYGTGFFLAALISMTAAIIELIVYLRNINYHTFVGQPVIHREDSGVFTRLVNIFKPKDEKDQKAQSSSS